MFLELIIVRCCAVMLGGPGCPGVLIAKKRLLPPPSAVPTTSGGGTVFFVTEDSHRYLSNREEREEGGTPGIISDIRMGLVMHIKQSVGVSHDFYFILFL